jgi:hypothetical protein
VAQHALSAVVPDFRPRVWWCPQLSLGLQYACKNGAVSMDHPIGELGMTGKRRGRAGTRKCAQRTGLWRPLAHTRLRHVARTH